MSDPSSRRSDRVTHIETLDPSVRSVLKAREAQVIGAARSANAAADNAADAVLQAMVALVEARADWEEQHARTMAVIAAHDAAADTVDAPHLPRPYVGPWILQHHAGVATALTATSLTREEREALPADIQSFVENWIRRIEVVRSRRDPGRSRLAAAG